MQDPSGYGGYGGGYGPPPPGDYGHTAPLPPMPPPPPRRRVGLLSYVAVALVATDRATGSLPDVVMLTGMYAALFAFAAWLFTRVPR